MTDQKRIFIKPRDGLKVRRPDNAQYLKPEGELVMLGTYWLRRLKVGDVVKSSPVKAVKSKGDK